VQDLGPAGALSRRDLLVLHGRIGGAEVHGQLGELFDAAAGADALVVDGDFRVGRLELPDPLHIQGFREGGAGPVQAGGREGAAAGGRGTAAGGRAGIPGSGSAAGGRRAAARAR